MGWRTPFFQRTVTEVHSEATYSNFRRFETEVSFKVPKIEG